jgi:hypothetical protein
MPATALPEPDVQVVRSGQKGFFMGQRLFSRVAGKALLAFALSAGLVACGGSSPETQQSLYPYEAGVDYGWTDASAPGNPYPQGRGFPWRGLTLGTLAEPTDSFLTDQNWVSASSGYGPVEVDRSNNTRAGGDGQTLTIGGVSYARGLGLHALSDVRYNLAGACSTFTASVGVDDEVGSRGSVVFQVWNGASTLLYQTPVQRGTDPALPITVNVTDVQDLRLVVTDAGDGLQFDHADWADAKLRCTASAPSGDKFLSDLAPSAAVNGYGPYERDRSNGEKVGGDGRPLTIAGVSYSRGLGVHPLSQLTYPLDGNCSTFTASVGVDDEVGSRGSVVFQVLLDGIPLYNSGVLRGTDGARAVNVNVAGAAELRLMVTDAGDGLQFDHADWANAKLSCSVITPEVTGVTVNPASAVLTVGATRQFVADVQGRGAYDAGVIWTSSDPAVASVDSTGLLTASAPGAVTVRATSTFDASRSGAASVTVNALSTLPPGGVRIDFQPAGAPTEPGYVADTGAAYSDALGRGWIREDSVGGSPVPLDISPNARNRNLSGIDPRLNTFMHMQFPANVANAAAVRTPAAWEYALPSGVYSVTVGVGDASNTFDSNHQINVEGTLVLPGFLPTSPRKFSAVTLPVNVTDGRLTIDARGGTNTKLTYVVIQRGDRPSARVTSPQDHQTMVPTTNSVTVDVNLPTSAIDLSTLRSPGVRLTNVGTGLEVPASINTSGGGDVIVLKPDAPLQANSQYVFEVNESVKDTSGTPFLPTQLKFVTGMSAGGGSSVAFEQVALQNVPARPYTTVEIGPDGKLYAATLLGEIMRFGIQPDGTLDPPQVITSVQAANGGPRSILGLKFDPAATAEDPVLWISNNYFWDGTADAPDWSGKITRLSGPNLENVQDIVVGLPRSIRDHATNAISFKPGEPNTLYVMQGSNTAMGAPDTAWGNRPERLLTAALLRVDLSKITAAPLSVKTAEGGFYDPFAPGAPVTIYASGLRNGYDMVWHTNGQLYVPTNGSSAGGNTPASPATLPGACNPRPDGPYTGPPVPGLSNVVGQRDFLFRVTRGGYYGHPNAARCEWVLNGGNPTSGSDRGEVAAYPLGTLPDRNWRGFAYDFGEHASANGVIEEYTSAPTSALRGKLLVVRYSAGKDIIVLTPGGPNQDIVAAETLITGLTDFKPSPLDLTENRTNGHLYVAQLDEQTGSGKITLVRLR